jgi:pyridoxine 4-dehydrogenase
MLNSGEFYSNDPLGDPGRNLRLLARFYDKYPEYVDKTYLSVKGGLARGEFRADASEENLRASVDTINKTLGGRKKMDLFEMARVDKSRSVEEAMRNMLKLRDEGHFKDIGLSEVSAKTIRAAAAVAPIAAVEVEYSPWSLDIEHNQVLSTCKELGIPIIAYSPLGRGFLTGTIRTIDDLDKDDNRRHFDRFKPGNFEKNLKVVDDLGAVAKAKGLTPVQLILAWEIAQSEVIYPIPGSTRPEGVKESLQALKVKLTDADIKEIRGIVDSADIVGGRYNEHLAASLEG